MKTTELRVVFMVKFRSKMNILLCLDYLRYVNYISVYHSLNIILYISTIYQLHSLTFFFCLCVTNFSIISHEA